MTSHQGVPLFFPSVSGIGCGLLSVVDRRRGGCMGVLESDEEVFGEGRTGLSYPAYVGE